MMTITTMKVAAAAATSLLSLLAATAVIAADQEEGVHNFRAARGMGGGLVKFMMVSLDLWDGYTKF